MERCEAVHVRNILTTINECEKAIKSIEMIKTNNIHISGEENYMRVAVLPEVRKQIKEIAINAYIKRIEEMEKKLADI